MDQRWEWLAIAAAALLFLAPKGWRPWAAIGLGAAMLFLFTVAAASQ